MGRGVKPPGVDPGGAQGTLLGFLSRAPLAPADANEERPLRRDGDEGGARAPRRARGSPARTPAASARPAPGTTSSLARDRGDPRAASSSRRVPRAWRTLCSIARSINGWERLADATLRRASDDDDEARSRRARRTSSAIASLVARAYEHRVGERARPAPARPRSRAGRRRRRSRLSATPAGPRVVNARSAPLWSVRRTRSASPASPSSACATSRVRPRRPRRCPPRATPRFEPRFPPPAVRRRRRHGERLSRRVPNGHPQGIRRRAVRPVLARRGLGDSGSVARSLSSLAWASDGLYVATTSGDAGRSRSSTSPPGAPPGSFTRARRGTARDARPRRSPRAPRPPRSASWTRRSSPGNPNPKSSRRAAEGRRSCGTRGAPEARRARSSRRPRTPRPRSRACA